MGKVWDSFFTAYKGKRIWKSIMRGYCLDESTCLVLAFDSNPELNESAARHLNGFLKRKYIKSVAVVTNDSHMLNGLQSNLDDNIRLYAIKKSEDEIEMLCRYYRLVQFMKNIVVLSLEEPYETGGLLNKPGIKVDDLVRLSILGW